MKKRVFELEGAELDYWVARAIGHDAEIGQYTESGNPVCRIKDWNRPGTRVNGSRFEPSTDWAHGGPIIEYEAIGFHPISDAEWMAEEHITCCRGRGLTPLVAAMRALVASKFGQDVPLLHA